MGAVLEYRSAGGRKRAGRTIALTKTCLAANISGAIQSLVGMVVALVEEIKKAEDKAGAVAPLALGYNGWRDYAHQTENEAAPVGSVARPRITRPPRAARNHRQVIPQDSRGASWQKEVGSGGGR